MATKQKHLEKRALIRLAVFGAAFVIFLTFSFLGLAANSNGAKQRYDKLIAVDQAGGDVETALSDLRVYIYSHMNTQIGSDTGINPPIQLKGTYERLVQEANANANIGNENLYNEAQSYCEEKHPEWSATQRLVCIEEYVDDEGVTINRVEIEDDLYKFDFAPPVWSFDFAGISIGLAVIAFVAFLVDLGLYFRTKHMINMGN